MSPVLRFGASRARVRAGLGVVLVVAATFGAAACGITADETPRRIPDNAVPEILRGTPDTTVPTPESTVSTP